MWEKTGQPFRKRIYEPRLLVSKSKDCRIIPVSKHFNETGHPLRDMQFSLLEWCSLKYNTDKSDHRKMVEKWCMCNVGAIHPIGINQLFFLLIRLPEHPQDPVLQVRVCLYDEGSDCPGQFG